MRTHFSVKNLIVFRLSRNIDLSKLDEQAGHFKFTSCGAQDIAKSGWISPMGDEFESLTHRAAGTILLCMKSEKKNIPSSIIKEKLNEKVVKLEAEQLRKLKRTEIATLKDDILYELLPITLPKANRTYIWIDTQASLIIIDASSTRKAEDVTALLRKTIGSLPIVPLTMKKPVELTLTEWVRSGNLPANFMFGNDVTLKTLLEEGGTVSVRNQELICDEIVGHIETGKVVTKLALNWQERISFILNDDVTIGRIRFSETLKEQNDDIDNDDFPQRFDADFVLYTGELMALINTMIMDLGGEAELKSDHDGEGTGEAKA
ncbi:recombination-associated protein RdgC [Xenorhabdus sp. KJ12.1]|uniref:recombination-associated protein RdgC n=1 Tax=Xenorhabdus sp. KJ12.1 TaxID=1851571 RepID=UPI000C03A4A2|nr:recombination-associated protein RdgC [Xenorhabdus sp. KJ12.1]PHM72329.1 recombination associated protein [Xenorhabdus sp. KJ12.1]